MEKCTKGYFEFDTRQDGLYLTVYPPQQGEPALDAGEVLYYIEKKNIYGCDITLIGDTVKKGQVICIVEAMKLMNEIESEFDGEIAEICVKDGKSFLLIQNYIK